MQGEIEAKQLRSFGLMVGGIFAFIGLWPTLFRGKEPLLPALIVGGLLIILALLLPMSLRAVYRVWMIIGNAMRWLNTRVILGIGFYGILTPMGFALRLIGKDPMRRKFDPGTDTYRLVRSPHPGPHMQRQF